MTNPTLMPWSQDYEHQKIWIAIQNIIKHGTGGVLPVNVATYADMVASLTLGSPKFYTVAVDETTGGKNVSYYYNGVGGAESLSNLNGSTNNLEIQDTATEWWTYPIATYLSTPFERTLIGAISSTGEVLACQYNHTTKKLIKYKVGQAIVDDHCCPALYASPNKRSVVAWTNHNGDNFIKIRVGSLSGDITLWLPEISIDLGSLASYTQIHRINSESDTTQETYILFTRYNNTFWGMLTFSVNQASGVVSITRTFRTIISGVGKQTYISTADAFTSTGQTIRVSFAYNPSESVHDIHYLEIDLVTGAVTSPVTPGLTGNIYTPTSMPILESALTPLIKSVTGQSRRLFYTRSGPIPYGVAYADWRLSTPDKALYATIGSVAAISEKGLRTNTSLGYAQTPYKVEMSVNDFTAEVFLRLNAVTAGNSDIIRRRTSATDGWYFQLLNSGDTSLKGRIISFSYNTSTGVTRTATALTVLPITSFEKIGLRAIFKTNVSGNSVVWMQFSLDNGESWLNIDDNPEGFNLGASIPPLINTLPLSVPSSSATQTVMVNAFYYSARLLDVNNAPIVGVDFTAQTLAASSFAGVSGETWTLSGSAAIANNSTPTFQTEVFGISGPRIGYSAESNYIPGMCFPTPAYDDTIYVARKNTISSVSTLEKFKRIDSNTNYSKEILSQSSLKLCRPYSPVNSNTIPVIYTEFDLYGDDFTVYHGKIKSIQN